MFNEKDFVHDFVEAAKAQDEATMKKLAESVSDMDAQARVDLLGQLVEALHEVKMDVEDEQQYVNEVTGGLAATLELMKLAVEAKQTSEGEEESKDSTGEEAKDEESKAVEATQDVAADTSAAEAETPDGKSDVSQGEAEGEAPTEEEKTEKSEQK